MFNTCQNVAQIIFANTHEANAFQELWGDDALFAMQRFLPYPEALTYFANIVVADEALCANSLETALFRLSETKVHPESQRHSSGYAWNENSITIRKDGTNEPPMSLYAFLEVAFRDIIQTPSNRDPRFLSLLENVRDALNAAIGENHAFVDRAFAGFLRATGGYVHKEDWALDTWGVSWDVSEPIERQEDTFRVTFETPWGPPARFFEKLSEAFPQAECLLQYAVPDMNIYGNMRICNGVISELPEQYSQPALS